MLADIRNELLNQLIAKQMLWGAMLFFCSPFEEQRRFLQADLFNSEILSFAFPNVIP
jgi:hypothetical protein